MSDLERSWAARAEPLPPLSRRAEQRRRRLRRVRQQIAAALAVLIAGTLGLTYALAGGGSRPPAVAVAQDRTQRTLLLQLQAPNGAGVTGALVGIDTASRTGSALLLPSDLLVPVSGGDPVPLARALPTVAPEALRAAVGEALQVTVDAGWVLDQPTAQRLIDGLGGIEVTMVSPVSANGRVLLPAGRQRLNGARAVALMTYLGPGEQPRARATRLQPILDGLAAALPPDRARLQVLLERLGRRSVSSLPPRELAGLLAGLRGARAGAAFRQLPLPVVPASAPDIASATRVDPRPARQAVDRLLAGSVLPDARRAGNRVVVLDGVRRPGVAERVRARLADAGQVVVGVRAAPGSGYARSQVVHASGDTREEAADVAAQLGLPDDAVRRGQTGDITDVVVLVGRDLRP